MAELIPAGNEALLLAVGQKTREWAQAIRAAEEGEVALIELLPLVLGVLRDEGVIVPPDFLAKAMS